MAEIIVRPKAFTREWFSYVWDYYKYHILISVALIVILVISTVQIITSVKYDTNINFIAESVIATEKAEEIAALCAKNSDDLNNNGRVDISFTQLNFTPQNRQNGEMLAALYSKRDAVFSSNDELVFIVDEIMRDETLEMKSTKNMFYEVSEWTKEDSLKKGSYAVSLAESNVLKNLNIDSSNLYVMIAKYDHEDGFKPQEKNAIKIANFLLK